MQFVLWRYRGWLGALPVTGLMVQPLPVRFVAREYTQAEYRWIKRFGDGHRHKMPWWGGFDPHAWDVASLMDFVVPVVACAGLYGCMLIFS